jgi:transcriptional regulator with PAS, ATPase and Fis domain
VIARAVHNASPRARQAFVAINCAAIPENLLESELFGYVRGAFTGATTDKPGLFEHADGGTMFLDEIGELPISLQGKLLRVLQEGEIRRVGDRKNRTVDVRLVAATARDLVVETKEGRFREDLFYRLNVVPIHLPPLAERPEDIASLARHFAALLAARLRRPLQLSDAAIDWLSQQPWPGNVRELAHAIERAAVLSDAELLEPQHFHRDAAGGRGSDDAARDLPADGDGTLRQAVERAERDAIEAALRAAGGNRRIAAERLGISLRTLFNKLDRLKTLE